jgi:serine protease Do
MTRLFPTVLAATSIIFSLTAQSLAQDRPAETRPADPAAAVKIADAVTPSAVRVEFTLQYDKGEEPYGAGWRQRCPSCGQYHAAMTDDVIAEERPVEIAGWVIAPNTVIASDPLMHNRFIKEVSVRGSDGTLIKATPAWYAQRGSIMALELAQPLKDAKPLAFDAKASGPYSSVIYSQGNGVWLVGVESLSGNVAIGEDNRRYTAAYPSALIVNREGVAVGMAVNEELPLDGSWKGSPLDWPKISHADLAKTLANFEQTSDQALPRIALNFRSPKANEQARMRYSEEEASATEWNGSGILIDPQRVLVLANLKPDVTARLERITVVAPDGTEHEAKFTATLRDYGAFIATLDQPMTGPANLSAADVRTHRHDMLLGAEVEVHGEQRTAYCTHDRITGFEIGWKRRVYPQSSGAQQFLFTPDGALVAIPIARRQKVTVEERWDSDSPILTAAADVAATLADLDANIDPNNTPLSDEEENRIAWMGVELQGLDPELARANNVSELTQDGQTGALVTWVYDDSPAKQAGLVVGDILLRLHVEGHPKPLDVEGVDQDNPFGAMGFPWDRLDELPEEYYGQIPSPWPSANNTLNRKLTQLGFDTAYQAEVIRDGKPVELALSVEISPPHYDSAAKFKHEELGITVRNLTYEVQRYLQRTADEPGVIVSMIEPGSRASIAGLKPFEVVTHVNDQPVMTASEFEQLTTGENGNQELRLSIKRMTRGRIVKIDPTAAVPEREEEADEEAPPALEPAGGMEGDGGNE